MDFRTTGGDLPSLGRTRNGFIIGPLPSLARPAGPVLWRSWKSLFITYRRASRRPNQNNPPAGDLRCVDLGPIWAPQFVLGEATNSNQLMARRRRLLDRRVS